MLAQISIRLVGVARGVNGMLATPFADEQQTRLWTTRTACSAATALFCFLLSLGVGASAATNDNALDDGESQLWWSPFVDSDDIAVEVHSGAATLRGTAEDWHEFQMAQKNARDGGATAVINKLKIENGHGA